MNGNLKHLFKTYVRRARIKEIVFTITLDEFASLTKRRCYICGARPTSKYKQNKSTRQKAYIYNGIDRIVNTRGYEPGNVAACCKLCNRAKQTLTLYQYLKYIQRCYKFAIEPYLNDEDQDV